ncbi:MAG: sugar phosphate nucleotidyltransferase [Janthinobacterium lividum]
MTKIKPIILAGGLGTRLWTLSYHFHLKQFVKIFDGQSLLQRTIIRNLPFGKPTIIIGEFYEKIAIDQIKELGIRFDIIIEPMPKNTAPCAIIVALIAREKKASKILLLPVDHHIPEARSYLSTIDKMIHNPSPLSVIGIRPVSAHTGYGYIKTSNMISEEVYEGDQFIDSTIVRADQHSAGAKKKIWGAMKRSGEVRAD